jgi:hypothetical protein
MLFYYAPTFLNVSANYSTVRVQESRLESVLGLVPHSIRKCDFRRKNKYKTVLRIRILANLLNPFLDLDQGVG